MLARIYSSAIVGIESLLCEVEVDIGQGGFERSTIVGLPDAAVKESIDRVHSAIRNCGYPYPRTASIINLAPGNIKKEGPSFDLPMALGMLAGQGVLENDGLKEVMIAGELALDGRVRPIRGVLPMAIMAGEKGFTTLIVPKENAREAAVVQDLKVIPVSSLTEVVGYLNGQLPLEPTDVDLEEVFNRSRQYDVDFSDVRGQESVKRALTVAAAGHHNILMIGPPGTGKTMLTQRIPTILPDLTLEESLETTRIYSVLGLLAKDQPLLGTRPVRSPHHSASGPALVGGGSIPRPGELSLAHNGLLFLDEFPEFSRGVLETIRQPLEDGSVTISRAAGTLTFPANIMLVAAMNPCFCGYLTDPKRKCTCTPNQIERYLSRISGPLADRIDIHVEVPPIRYEQLASKQEGTNSSSMREQVLAARKIQQKRFKNTSIRTNSRMGSRQVRDYCPISPDCGMLMKQAVYELGLSARAHDKVLKLSRTIADLEQRSDIQTHHIAEAIQYRRLDRRL